MAADTNTSTTRLTFFVNGKKHEVDHVDPRTTLASYLRNQMHLTGTKIGCNEGGCGACTVMISDQAPESGAIQHYSVNACLMPVCSVNGKAVTTVEGIGSLVRQRLHPIQERLAKAHGSQCGFCTPGFIMAMYALLRNYPQPTEEQIDVALQGNLCRCTGYRPILEAFYSFAKGGIGCCQSNGAMTNGCCQQNGSAENGSCQQNGVKELNGGGCCQQNGEGEAKVGCCKSGERKELTTLVNFTDCSAYDSSQEPIFPPELLIKTEHPLASWSMLDSGISWYQPSSVAELVDLKSRFPEARI
uniref:2Fe-2S ferredoxin-type domain-containing protein n=1 Tax=Plectus sambesii TaxID=2011161 RepID=A0A914X7U9_9BILA